MPKNIRSLPLELLRMILAEITDPDDFIAMVTAFGQASSAFNTGRKSVLMQNITKATTSEGLPHALALADYLAGKPWGPRSNRWRTETVDVSKLGFPMETMALMRMWRLQLVMSSHVDCYAYCAHHEITQSALAVNAHATGDIIKAQATHTFLPGSRNGRPPLALPDLSLAERGRLERAFYRLELYNAIFPKQWVPEGAAFTTADEQAERWADFAIRRYGLFGENFTPREPGPERWQPWETAEMLAMHEYSSRKIRERIFRLNSDLKDAILATPGLIQLPPDDQEQPSLDTSMYFIPRDLHLFGMRMYGDEREQDRQTLANRRRQLACELTAKGATFVAKLVSADLRTFKKMVRVDRRGFPRSIPYEMFRRSLWAHGVDGLNSGQRVPVWSNKIVVPEQEGIASDQDGIRSGTVGFRTYYQDVLSGRCLSTGNRRLAMMAAPFWDASRMRTSDFATAFSVVHSRQTSNNDRIDLAYSFLSTELDVKHVAMPMKDARRVQKLFGHLGSRCITL